MKTIFTLIALSLLSCSFAHSETIHLKKDIFVIAGGGGKGSNVGVILDGDKTLIVDTMMDHAEEYLLGELQKISKNQVSHLFNTHDHFDHTGSNLHFLDRGATLVTSSAAEAPDKNSSISFSGQLQLQTNKHRIYAYSVGSHAASDVLYFLPDSNIVFLGDTYSDEWYPAFFHGGLKAQLEVIELALSLGDDSTQYIPGHGNIVKADALKQYATSCRKWVERLKLLHAKGLSPQQMTQDKKLLTIRESFAAESTNRENFDKFFSRLITNTLKSEVSDYKPPKTEAGNF